MVETTGSRKAESRMVTGLFRDRESAERAYGSLTERGYGQDDVNLEDVRCVVTSREGSIKGLADAFVAAIALHRHWERETRP